jgi:hypothetical protein
MGVLVPRELEAGAAGLHVVELRHGHEPAGSARRELSSSRGNDRVGSWAWSVEVRPTGLLVIGAADWAIFRSRQG